MFSSRIPANQPENRLTQVRARLAAAAVDVVDLAESNPTRVGLVYPPDLLAPLADPRALVYQPAPRGLLEARRAVAAHLSRGSTMVDARRVALTASTSEAYSCLFKLLCDPGARVMVPQPGYPLLDHLARLEGIEPVPYRLRYYGRWEIDVDSLRTAMARGARVVVAVSPNNPTGAVLSADDHRAVQALCARHGSALIVDEVFGRYPCGAAAPAPSVLDAPASVVTFCLGGLSKAIGLPQAKLGWIVVDGPPADVEHALARLELILDTYLSVSTPVQVATPRLLAEGEVVTRQIQRRIAGNHEVLTRAVGRYPSVRPLAIEGGWYAVVQVPAVIGEERLALELLEDDHIYVHPGYFFDFPREAFVVVSLLPAPDRFEPAVRRLLARASGDAARPAP